MLDYLKFKILKFFKIPLPIFYLCIPHVHIYLIKILSITLYLFSYIKALKKLLLTLVSSILLTYIPLYFKTNLFLKIKNYKLNTYNIYLTFTFKDKHSYTSKHNREIGQTKVKHQPLSLLHTFAKKVNVAIVRGSFSSPNQIKTIQPANRYRVPLRLRSREQSISKKAFSNTMDWWVICPTEPIPLPHH